MLVFILTWRPYNFRVGGLLEFSVPFSKIISVFCAERMSFFFSHYSSIIPMTICRFDLGATISGNYYQEVVHVCDRTPLRPRVSSKTRFQRLGPRNMDSCEYPLVAFFVTGPRLPTIRLASSRQQEGIGSSDNLSLASGTTCSATYMVKRSLDVK